MVLFAFLQNRLRFFFNCFFNHFSRFCFDFDNGCRDRFRNGCFNGFFDFCDFFRFFGLLQLIAQAAMLSKSSDPSFVTVVKAAISEIADLA